jgi:hypothetical protein
VATHTTSIPEASGSGDHDRVATPVPVSPALVLDQEESDLSSLSGDSDEASGDEEIQAFTSTERGRGRGRPPTQGKAGHPKSPDLGDVSLPPGERLESGTLGITLRHSALRTISDSNLQFGRNTSRILGGAPSCTTMICRRFRRASYNELITRETTSSGSMINLIYGTCVYELGRNVLIWLPLFPGRGYLRKC